MGKPPAVRLSDSTLAGISSKVQVPRYQRRNVKQGIMHMSVGGFHRAHAALYIDELLDAEEALDWGICGVGLLPGDAEMRDALVPQDCLYTLLEKGREGERARIIGSLTQYIFGPDNPEAVFAKMLEPGIRIVTLTVTEKGYCFNQGTGEFDPALAEVRHDLKNPTRPATVLGYLTEGLNRIREKRLSPPTVLSCDNIQSNGDTARAMVRAFAQLRDPALAEWISANVSFPNCMVDRITPVTTDQDRAHVRDAYGIEDGWPVVCEPFRQWVIEDRFGGGRPGWETVGVQMTGNVLPYELMKLRLLNGGHSAIGYLGYLAGYAYIHDIARDPSFREYLRRLMDQEVTPILSPVPGIDLVEYKSALLERFANAHIGDRAARICQNGSAKMPKFVLPSIREQRAREGPIRLLSLAVAGWFRYLSGVDERGSRIEIDDPMRDKLCAYASHGREDPRKLLGLSEVFGHDLGGDSEFVAEVGRALRLLYEKGSRATVVRYLQAD